MEENLLIQQDLGPFKIKPSDLEKIFNLCEKRSQCEELDYIQEQGLSQIFDALLTSPSQGTIKQQNEQRSRVYGVNRRYIRPPKSYVELLCDAMEDFTMRILLAASILSIAIEVGTADESHRSIAWIEGFAIMLAVLVCSNVAAFNDYSKERQFMKLNEASDKSKTVTVIRDGEPHIIHQDDVLVGDIVKLIEGMVQQQQLNIYKQEIPADGVIIESSDVSMDESSMTGEAHAIRKATCEECLKVKLEIQAEGRILGEQDRFEIPSPALLSGTRVLEGEGLFLICVVGDNSCVETPLQIKLTDIAEDIGKYGLMASILIVAILLVRLAVERIVADEWDHTKHWKEILDFIIIGIVVLAVAIPEGLPLSVTLSLAFSVQKMMDDHNLVRKMYACETMGGADIICSDKTGTLTMNKMFLTMVWQSRYIDIDPYGSKQDIKQISSQQIEVLWLQSLSCNTSAELLPMKTGSKTEIALLEYLEKCGINYRDQKQLYKVIKKMPFSSSRKRMSIILALPNGKQRILLKGASEIVAESLTHYLQEDGVVKKIDDQYRKQIADAISSMAQKALRTLCLAFRDLDGTENLEKTVGKIYEVETQGMTFLAILGIQDTLREGVPEAVERCRIAGITVKMVTGDNKETARAIAIQCGIIRKGDDKALVMEGPEFVEAIGGVVCKNCQLARCPCAKSQKEADEKKIKVRVDTIGNMKVFKQLYPRVAVMARSRPHDKYAMIVGLKECEHVVAVTGDGTNDAPALKKADVGFAMGITGTQVAKDAAAIILMEDNFTDIVKAVMWGRNIFQSIRKFLQFQLTVNIVAVCLTLLTSAVLKQEVLKAIQLLWVNLIMDSFASLALATEPPTEQLLNNPPYGRNEYIVTTKMFKHIIGQSIYQMAILLLFVFTGEQWIPEYHDSWDHTLFENKKFHYKYNKDYYPDLLRITNGRFRSIDGNEIQYEAVWNDTYNPSRHFTIIFNLFVVMTIFNFFNARRLNDEFNIFSNIIKSPFFFLIVLFIIILQIIIVTFGGIAFGCYSYNGLTPEHWGICFAFGIFGWVISALLKFFPEQKVFQLIFYVEQFFPIKSEQGIQTIPVSSIQHKKSSSLVLSLRRGSQQSKRDKPPSFKMKVSIKQ